MTRLRFPDSGKTVEGAAFSDYIYTERQQRKNRKSDKENHSMRPVFLLYLLFAVVLILFGRTFFLQIIEGNYYKMLSDNNRIKTVAIHAPRGVIFDRNNVPLVYNVPGFREEINGKTKFLSQEEAIPIIAKGGNNLEVDTLREYPFKDAFMHVLGYVGQISKEELSDPKFQNYKSTDVVGKTGIEGEYENLLKGVDGREFLEVDSSGNTIRIIGQDDPIPGENIVLNLDSSLQKVAYAAMQGVQKGAVIVSTPTGEILALVSKPSFDPNLFTMGEDYKTDSKQEYMTASDVLLNNTDQPFLDRAISGTYPPGSTFKIIVASTGLEDKIIDTNYQVEDTGILNLGSFSFANWYYTDYGRTDGMVNIIKALQRSNDIFFYQLAQKIGVDKISAMAGQFGLGNVLGIDLPGEAAGLVPTEEWKQKVIGEQWYLGDTYHYGIGQGYLLTTPLQVNSWTQVIANGGMLYRPYLLKKLGSKVVNSGFLSKNTIDLVREGMIEACSPGGVAWPLFNYSVKNAKLKIDGENITEAYQATTSAGFQDYRHVVLACKTGTAQYGSATTLADAWVTLFAPAYNPQIVITVLAEDSGEGSNVAAPIAEKILNEWFGR